MSGSDLYISVLAEKNLHEKGENGGYKTGTWTFILLVAVLLQFLTVFLSVSNSKPEQKKQFSIISNKYIIDNIKKELLCFLFPITIYIF